MTVPLYTDDRADNAAYILQDAAVKVLLVQDAGRWRRLAEALGDQPYPERVVILDDSEKAERLAEEDERVVTSAAWLPAEGPELQQRDGDPDELATIVYTSGTTGRPKGVMLSHRNILTNAHAGLTALDVYQEDVFLSFLPLSHTLERTGSYYLPMMAGSAVAYARSVGQLAEDLQTIQPTVMIAVPRVFERVYRGCWTRFGAAPPRCAGCSISRSRRLAQVRARPRPRRLASLVASLALPAQEGGGPGAGQARRTPAGDGERRRCPVDRRWRGCSSVSGCRWCRVTG